MHYPYSATPDGPDLLLQFRDVPEALTGWPADGPDPDEVADGAPATITAHALDCLLAALQGYMKARRAIPAPSEPTRGERTIQLPVLVAAKLALYEEMRANEMTNVALAARLGLSEAAVRRLLDLRHDSRIGQVETAMAAFDKHLAVTVEAA